jgi:hypothetical protein
VIAYKAMIHKIVFWKPGTSGVASTDSLFFYAVLVAETPPAWHQPQKKVIAILPLGDNAPQPAQLIDSVVAADEIAALNWVKAQLAGLPGLKGYQVQAS